MNDILLDENFDLIIDEVLDDFVLGDATHQNQGLILLANKGEFRQFPFVGVGLRNYIEDDRMGSLKPELTKQLELDGMTVRNIGVFTDGRVEIDAGYE